MATIAQAIRMALHYGEQNLGVTDVFGIVGSAYDDVLVDEAYVDRMLADIVRNEDLSRYIL